MSLDAAYIVPHPPLAVPEVGRGQVALISATLDGYAEVSRRVAAHEPSAIIFISPHSAYFADWIYIAAGEGASGSFGQFGAGHVELSLFYDAGFTDDLIGCAKRHNIPAGFTGPTAQALDHGVLVPLYFIERELPSTRYRAVSIGGSGLPAHDLLAFGRCIASVASAYDGRVVLVVSGDLSHKLKDDGPYGYDPAGPVFDREFARVVTSGDPMGFATIDPAVSGPAAECGLSGFIMLAGAIDGTRTREGASFSSELLALEGPFGVGYGVAAFERLSRT